jgi:hypothetical protein
MVPEKPKGRFTEGLSGGNKKRPHHISAIAHHFLEPNEQETALDSDRAECLAVAGSGHGHLIAWVCSGMIRGMRSCQVQLRESPRLHWSAVSHLQDLSPEIQSDSRDLALAESLVPCIWSISPEALPPSPRSISPNRAHQNGRFFPVRNLGSLNNYQLGLLEAANLVPGAEVLRLPARSTLAWCLGPSEAGSLSSFYTLNRALRLLMPMRLEIIIVDQGCLSSPRSELSALDPCDVDRCREAMSSITDPAAVGLTVLSRQEGESSPSPGTVLSQFGQKVAGADDSD